MSSPVSCLLISLCLVLGLTVSLVWGQTPTQLMIGYDDVVTPGSTIPMTIVGAGGSGPRRGLGLSPLYCFTPSPSTAVWLLPDGNIVPPPMQAGFTAPPNTIQSRVQGNILSLHRGDGFITGGEYCCGSETNVNERLCVTLASCPLLALDNGVVTYTDPPVDNVHNSFTANHTCFNGYLLVGDSIRICDISGGTGIWRGEHRTCNEPRVKFILRDQTYLNNSIVAINDIGEGDNALLCVTDNPDCCNIKNNKGGEFYYPNNSAVPGNFHSSNSLYRNRDSQVVRLNRRNDVLSPTGIYKCKIPDSTGMNRNIYINVTDIDCGPLFHPAYGQVNISSGTTFNRIATYSCYTGYKVTGESARVCTADGQWTPTAPTCVVIDCEIPPNPEHGYVDTSTGTVFNSLAMYSCDVGYMLDGVSRSVCGPDGIWSPGTPTCPIVDCGPLRDPDNGMVDTSRGTTYNSRATYTCDKGYNLNGTDSRICQPDGMWSAIEPVCNLVDCGPLLNPEKGHVNTSSGTTYNRVAFYTCIEGYVLVGEPERHCDPNGIWTPSAPSCVPVDCGPLRQPNNGIVDTIPGTYLNSTATYSCNPGYNLTESTQRVCQSNGSWSSSAPYCAVVDCGPLLNPEKGHVNTSSGTTYNSVAFYTCIEGYELVGQPERYCDRDGMWTPRAPWCVPVDCGPLRQPKNGVVNTIPDTYLNSTATYSCNPGYNLTGNTQRVCQPNGLWSSSAPYCADSAMVQVKFGPTSHCVEWSESRVELMYKMLRESIFKAIVEKGGQPIAEDKINKGYFSCYSSNTRTTYRTTISGLENTSAVHLAELVQKWVESGVSMRALWYVIKIDKSCPVLISSIDDDECA